MTIEPVIARTGRVVHPDGSEIVVGHFGGQQEGCGVGTQAYVQRLAADGTEAWLRCHRSVLGGLCGQRSGLALLADFTSIDPAYIVASRVHDVAVHEDNGEIAITGELILACRGGEGVDVSRNAFIALLSPSGVLIADTVIGDQVVCQPIGDPICCRELCAEGGVDGGGDGDQCGGRGIDIGPGGIAMTGWCSAPGRLSGRDLVVGSFSNDLTERWWFEDGTPRQDIGLDAAIDENGQVYVTGFMTGATRRDVFVSSHVAADGELRRAWLDGGVLDDEGRSIEIDDEGALSLEGYIHEAASLAGEPIGGLGQGQQGFTAILDRATLVPVAIETLPMAMLGSQSVDMPLVPPPASPEMGDLLGLVGCSVTVGSGWGDCTRVLAGSGFLNLTGGVVPGTPPKTAVEIELTYEPQPMPFQVKSLSMKVAADSCYTATLSIKGLASEDFVVMTEKDVCPADEPILASPITTEVSETMGLTLQANPAPGVLGFRIRLDFGPGGGCQGCGSQAEEVSVDEVEIDYEY